jgi:hypothetical protein
MFRAFIVPLMLAATAFPVAAQAESACPSPSAISGTMKSLDLGKTTRSARFHIEFPERLYLKAAKRPGDPVAEREGDRAFGVLVAEIPLERLWMAVSDEAHHTLELPVRYSEVISGTPRGADRTIFQYFKRWGIGRWWVSSVHMNRELYESSGGTLWETWWEDSMEDVDLSKPPVSEVASDIKPILMSRGSWLFVPLGESCTLVEYFIWTDPGGAVSMAQRLLATKSVRNAVNGIARLAEEHVLLPHEGPPFVRPDGTPIQ